MYAQQGKIDDAVAAQRKSAELFGSAAFPMGELARDYALAGKLPEARQAVRDFLTRSERVHASPYGLAAAYAALGDKDQSFAYLDQALAQRSFFLDFLKLDPELDSLHSDPRFQKLLVHMKLN